LTDADFNFFDGPAVDTEVKMQDVLPDVSPEDSQVAHPEITQQSELLSLPTPELPSNGIKTEDSVVPAAQEPTIKRDSPVFAKPELMHARSILRDDARSTSKQGSSAQCVKSKREHSPFDPDTVFKRIRTSLYRPHPSSRPQLPRRKSAYDTVEFDLALNPVNNKYIDGGKFAVNWERSKDAQSPKKAPPTTDYLK